MRSTEMQVWLQFMKLPQTAALEATFRSASARTIMGSLPPSSSEEGISFLAQASAMRWPVATLPEKKTLLGPAAMRAAPGPQRPWTAWTDFFGLEPFGGTFGDEVGGVEGQNNFGEDGFAAGLARFTGNDVGDFVAIFE